MSTGRFELVVAAAVGAWPLSTAAAERKEAEVECMPVEEQALTYDCTIALRGRKSGEPIVDAEFHVGAGRRDQQGGSDHQGDGTRPGFGQRTGCAGEAFDCQHGSILLWCV